jgi:hypothetical protein
MGVVLTVIVVLLWVVVPQVRSGAQRSGEKALEQAELARRTAAHFSQVLPQVEARFAAVREQAGDLSGLAEALQEPGPDGKSRSVGEAQGALGAFDKTLSENRELLAQAVSAARAAASEAVGATGQPAMASVEMIAGMTQMLTAETKLVEAQRVRDEIDVLLAEAQRVGLQRRLTQIQADYFGELEIDPIVAELRTGEHGREWAAAGAAEAQRAADQLAQAVAAKEATLAGVQQRLQAARTELLALEERGYTVGDDAAFSAFRSAHAEIIERLRVAEREEQALIHGAPVAGADVASLTADQVEIGLEQLRRELALQQSLAARYTAAVVSFDKRIADIQGTADEAQRGVVDYSDRIARRQEELEAMLPQLAERANTAANLEVEALQAAAAARSAFAKAGTAMNQWRSAARETREKYDPQQTNERLRQIINDRFGEQYTRGAEAAARVLEGRVHWQRIDGMTRYADAMRRVSELHGQATFDDSTIREAVLASRDEGIKTLQQARDMLDGLARAGGATAWVSQSALATTLYLLARVDEPNRVELEYAAAAAAVAAVGAGERSPYLADQVVFRDYLVRRTGYTPPTDNTMQTPAEPGAEPR